MDLFAEEVENNLKKFFFFPSENFDKKRKMDFVKF